MKFLDVDKLYRSNKLKDYFIFVHSVVKPNAQVRSSNPCNIHGNFQSSKVAVCSTGSSIKMESTGSRGGRQGENGEAEDNKNDSSNWRKKLMWARLYISIDSVEHCTVGGIEHQRFE